MHAGQSHKGETAKQPNEALRRMGASPDLKLNVQKKVFNNEENTQQNLSLPTPRGKLFGEDWAAALTLKSGKKGRRNQNLSAKRAPQTG